VRRKGKGLGSNSSGRLAIAPALAICTLLLLTGGTASADIYDAGAGPLGDLVINGGVVTIDTGNVSPSTAPSVSGATSGNGAGDIEDNVAVFRFTNVSATAGTVVVTGQRPLAIVSAGDIVWDIALDASGARPGRIGGGQGGVGGAGASAGGTGGSGGTGLGAGGAATTGGRGGLRGGNPSGNGENGQVANGGSGGAQGSTGVAGSVGTIGGDGNLGLGTTGAQGASTVGTGGSAGGAGSLGGLLSNSGSGNPGGSGAGTGSAQVVNAIGNTGGTGAGGGVGQPGTIGQSGGNGGTGGPGTAATFEALAGTLDLAAGNGGGGGGGGGKGAGGQGGGQGGGAASGGGGGGGGATIASGNCGTQTNGLGGNGGAGGVGGAGGTGGNGGSASNGATGGVGGNGGGGVLLAARGLLNVTNTINVSATAPGAASGIVSSVAGASGAGGGSGGAVGGGGAASQATWNFLQGPYCTGVGSALAGAGGPGGAGGTGGSGGQGGASGSSGGGGAGGNGTPGMVKLHGSVVLAGGATVTANNAAGASANQNGKFTLVSNMTNADNTAQTPTLTSNGAIVPGVTTNDPILDGTNSFDADANHPNIGQLVAGAATEGILDPTYWNQADVNAENSATQRLTLVTLESGTSGGVFAGYDQVFLINNTANALNEVGFMVGGVFTEIPGGGILGPNEVFTTTVVTGNAATLVDPPQDLSLSFNPVADNLDHPVTTQVTFSVNITEQQGDVTYQWQKDDGIGGPFVDIPGETGPSYSFIAQSSDNNYNFRVVMEDNVQTVTSNAALLTINNDVAVVIDPIGADKYVGGSHSFDITGGVVGGDGNYTYVWKRDGVVIPSAPDAPIYTIASLILANQGSYTVQVTDGLGGTDESGPAQLNVFANLAFSPNPPATASVNVGDDLVLTVGTTGGIPTIAYQWQVSTAAPGGPYTDIGGATTTTLTVSNVTLADDAWYRVRATDSGTAPSGGPQVVFSTATDVTITNNINVTFPSAQTDAYDGETVVLTAGVAGGNGNYTYDWEFNSAPLTTGGNVTVAGDTVTITGVGAANNGTYSLTVSDDSGVNASDTDSTSVNSAPTPSIVTDPQDVSGYVGTTVNFSVSATGGLGTLSYDWRLNSVSLGAADQPTLSYGPLALGDNGGIIDVVVTDSGASDVSGTAAPVTSNGATMTVGDAPVITGPIPAITRAYTDDPAFNISVSVTGGLGVLNYEWFLDTGAVVVSLVGIAAGADSDTMTIDPSTPGLPTGEATVFVEVTDDVTTTTSGTASLEVDDHLSIGDLPDGEGLLGQDYTFEITTTGGLGDLTYIWSKDDGTKAFQAIPGAPDAPTYTIDPVVEASAGLYQITVSDEGSTVSATADSESDTATLTTAAGVPVAGLAGLAALSALSALGGALAIRRRKH
jgi:hypothetical protein